MSSGVSITIQDNGLGQVSPGAGRIMVVVGVTSTGTANQILASANPNDFITAYGYGPAVEAASLIANAAGQPVILIKATTNVTGTNSNVQPGGSNTSGSVVSLTGTPNDTYYGQVTVGTGGTVGTNGIILNISLDANRTFTPIALGTASTYAIPNTGLTLNFAAGTLVTGDTFKWFSKEPLWSDATVASAIQALWGYQTQFLNILITGDTASGDATSFATDQQTLFNKKQFTGILTNARDALWGGTSTETEATWMASIENDFQNFVSNYVSVSGGHYNITSPITQIQYRRPASWVAAVRDAQQNLGQDLGQVSSGPGGPGGPMAPLTLPSAADGFIYHNELVNPGLDGARFLALQSYQGFPGLYVDNPNMMAGPGSDFNWLQRVEVVNAFARLVYIFFTNELSQAVPVSQATGFILPAAANDIEQRCNAELTATLVGSSPPACTNAFVTITRTNNILATSQLIVTGSIIPLAYIKSVPITIRFVNPATAVVAGP
jgi:hypothetical protein